MQITQNALRVLINEVELFVLTIKSRETLLNHATN